MEPDHTAPATHYLTPIDLHCIVNLSPLTVTRVSDSCKASTASMSLTVDDDTGTKLHYTAHNSRGHTTVVLIHGAFASGLYWDLVLPHLPSSYHLLVPDLPGHGQSHAVTPFSVDLSVRLVADLIRTHAINGLAHVIGHSLGAQIAIHLASAHPDLVNSVFISGFELFPPTALTPYVPYAAWAMSRVENCLPRSLLRWAMDGADLPLIDTNACTLELCRQVVSPVTTSTTQWPSPWRARTLIVAAGKGGLIPSSDHPHDAVKLMEIGRELNPETVAYTHPSMRHPWNRQAPLLFAETSEAWFEQKELPGGFVKL
ncbi:Alpha/Beta hydrolase protein [Emericellopsis atlantica]|uniref:Alpha/Beta hydrolase protein n=1 Tax=Emericellopsis atlantica TaxID=2614577 RepID=A0A9P7ZKG1_9HYPO|nr:Alpha/Beta hydrolase protein [Emericellopsis atlantica]KAG9253645.1 Alpha/Beta hydrolase protein [Emericellopsis atlantica]